MGLNDVGGWRTSSYSDNGEDCVEVGAASGEVGVRDTKLPGTSPELRFAADAWAQFITHIKASA